MNKIMLAKFKTYILTLKYINHKHLEIIVKFKIYLTLIAILFL